MTETPTTARPPTIVIIRGPCTVKSTSPNTKIVKE